MIFCLWNLYNVKRIGIFDSYFIELFHFQCDFGGSDFLMDDQKILVLEDRLHNEKALGCLF